VRMAPLLAPLPACVSTPRVNVPSSNGSAVVPFLFPARGGSSSPCLHWMRMEIERNRRGHGGGALCRRRR
jgi:hypothetical protein